MVESIRELNKICQKPNYRTVGNWYVRNILRDAALPMTWLLLHTGVSANQVTFFSFLVASLGGLSYVIPGAGPFLVSALLLQFWYYLDHVDGQIARYRKTASMTGRFLDFMTHHLVHLILFFALGYYAYKALAREIFLLWGSVSSLAILAFNLIHDVKYKTFYERCCRDGAVIKKSSQGSKKTEQPKSFWRKAFSLAHKSCEIHVMINVLAGAALLQFVTVWDLRVLLFFYYGTVAPVVFGVKFFYIICSQAIDTEYGCFTCQKS
ncbi:MAG: CDP-alcohol phosphatidyltransferase [Chloroflexi bacterium ADurb.Bin344]|nr:MAG: CDP-alcohol phosphatidyltransferase [Chloroflexi bacterium ADurb.Bin344]